MIPFWQVILLLCLTHSFVSTVLGALIGKQTGRHIEIMNSFELSYDELDGHIIINREYYTLKEEQCRCLMLL